MGVKYEVLERSGTYFRYGEETLGQGREAARLFLTQNPKLMEKLEKEIRMAAGFDN
jgi:recombination protein RecA